LSLDGQEAVSALNLRRPRTSWSKCPLTPEPSRWVEALARHLDADDGERATLQPSLPRLFGRRAQPSIIEPWRV